MILCVLVDEIVKVKFKRDQKPPNKITDFFNCQLVRGLKTKILRLLVLFLFLVVSPVVDVIIFFEEIYISPKLKN